MLGYLGTVAQAVAKACQKRAFGAEFHIRTNALRNQPPVYIMMGLLRTISMKLQPDKLRPLVLLGLRDEHPQPISCPLHLQLARQSRHARSTKRESSMNSLRAACNVLMILVIAAINDSNEAVVAHLSLLHGWPRLYLPWTRSMKRCRVALWHLDVKPACLTARLETVEVLEPI